MDQSNVAVVNQPVSSTPEKGGKSWFGFFLLGIVVTLILAASAYGAWLFMGNTISLQSGQDKVDDEDKDLGSEKTEDTEWVEYEYSFIDKSFVDEENPSVWESTVTFKHPKDWVVKEEDIPAGDEETGNYKGKIVVTATSPSGSKFHHQHIKIGGFGIEYEQDHCNEEFLSGSIEDPAILSSCVFIKNEDDATKLARVVFNPEKPQPGVTFWRISSDYADYSDEERGDQLSGYYFPFTEFLTYMVKNDADLKTLDSIALTAGFDQVCIEKCDE
jgi:hypothetical protein